MNPSFPFEKIENRKKSTEIAAQILKAIRNNFYKPGEKLPPESKLAEDTGTSRSSVREALSALQIAGIIKSKAGDGTYVCGWGENAGLQLQVLFILEESESPFEAWEIRELIETYSARLAAEKVTSKHLAKLKQILTLMKEKLEADDYEGYLEMNRSFHLAISEVTENLLLKKIITYLLNILKQKLTHEISIEYVKEDPKRTIKEHEDIILAIRKADKDLAAQKVKKHFQEMERYFRERYLRS